MCRVKSLLLIAVWLHSDLGMRIPSLSQCSPRLLFEVKLVMNYPTTSGPLDEVTVQLWQAKATDSLFGAWEDDRLWYAVIQPSGKRHEPDKMRNTRDGFVSFQRMFKEYGKMILGYNFEARAKLDVVDAHVTRVQFESGTVRYSSKAPNTTYEQTKVVDLRITQAIGEAFKQIAEQKGQPPSLFKTGDDEYDFEQLIGREEKIKALSSSNACYNELAKQIDTTVQKRSEYCSASMFNFAVTCGPELTTQFIQERLTVTMMANAAIDPRYEKWYKSKGLMLAKMALESKAPKELFESRYSPVLVTPLPSTSGNPLYRTTRDTYYHIVMYLNKNPNEEQQILVNMKSQRCSIVEKAEISTKVGSEAFTVKKTKCLKCDGVQVLEDEVLNSGSLFLCSGLPEPSKQTGVLDSMMSDIKARFEFVEKLYNIHIKKGQKEMSLVELRSDSPEREQVLNKGNFHDGCKVFKVKHPGEVPPTHDGRVYYHGTGAFGNSIIKTGKYDLLSVGSNRNYGWYGAGVYFTTSPSQAKEYGKIGRTVLVNRLKSHARTDYKSASKNAYSDDARPARVISDTMFGQLKSGDAALKNGDFQHSYGVSFAPSDGYMTGHGTLRDSDREDEVVVFSPDDIWIEYVVQW